MKLMPIIIRLDQHIVTLSVCHMYLYAVISVYYDEIESLVRGAPVFIGFNEMQEHCALRPLSRHTTIIFMVEFYL